MEDHGFRVFRKNLNILSAVILLLAISNAEMTKLGLFRIELELEGSLDAKHSSIGLEFEKARIRSMKVALLPISDDDGLNFSEIVIDKPLNTSHNEFRTH
ncbi:MULTISPECIES: hypothetical protein [unclassified Imperialibacter]|uniref:hypothetical protein n=1 Tax=unclassified Imperialibacter TaxID=2629706 RepID=UPI00125AB05E|nr:MULTISPECIES: hypothetical protein [unclassified Imperialibacter]CAD5248150.1 hypothetical protein IMPERIA75_10237 [Imperialibacter sp. 75]CAD5248270.1 hypothetical protein IMPERIA89_10238 [Imperialibacter sp. 89]VVS97520.1 hypothetical protein IMPR6_10238 [Imperialibacter sp. EC-SDR9]